MLTSLVNKSTALNCYLVTSWLRRRYSAVSSVTSPTIIVTFLCYWSLSITLCPHPSKCRLLLEATGHAHCSVTMEVVCCLNAFYKTMLQRPLMSGLFHVHGNVFPFFFLTQTLSLFILAPHTYTDHSSISSSKYNTITHIFSIKKHMYCNNIGPFITSSQSLIITEPTSPFLHLKNIYTNSHIN
jgi:hypothetical protein